MEHIGQSNEQSDRSLNEPLYVSPVEIEVAFDSEDTEYDTEFYQVVRQTIRQYVMTVYKNVTLQQLSEMMGLDPVFLLRKIIPRGARKYIGKGNRVPIVTITYTPNSHFTTQGLPEVPHKSLSSVAGEQKETPDD